MLAGLRIVWRGIVQFEHYGWLYILANIIAIVLSLPIITAPAAYAALSHMSHTAQTGNTTTMSDFWSGFRQYFLRGILVGVINVIIIGMLIVNFSYYSTQLDISFVALRVSWLLVLTVWLGVQLYLWPILDEMEQPTLRGGLRNAAVMFFQNPFFSLMLLLILGVIVILSTVTFVPWILVTNAILACVANAAVLDRLGLVRQQKAPDVSIIPPSADS